MRCKSWVPVLSLRQGTTRTSRAYRTSHKPYWALHSKSRVNYTTVFWGIKQKMRQSIAYVLLMYCLCILGSFFWGFSRWRGGLRED